MRLLIVGDLHFRGTNPRSRRGDYQADMLAKVDEVCRIAKERHAQVLHVGDLFDSPGISYGVYGALAGVLQKYDPWLAVPGNHDIWGHSLSTLPRTPYGALDASDIIHDIHGSPVVWSDRDAVIGVGFDHTLDHDYHEYKPVFPDDCRRKILVVHGMLMMSEPPFERYSLVDEAAKVTTADIVLTGHYHEPFSIILNDKLFLNPGSLCRMSATDAEISRTPHVVLLDPESMYTEWIPLECAKPGSEVLDRSVIEESKERSEKMESFLASLEFASGSRMLNLQEIIDRIVAVEGASYEVVEMITQKLAAAREMRG
jgi:DNA repair protein SbcD/Mre11